MAKLYFKYGAMGSSKTAQALITKFNYEERGMKVWLLKPSTDQRDGIHMLHSRIGLEAPAEVITPEDDIYALYTQRDHPDVVITDECQFFTPAQIDQLRRLVDERDLPVLCFGLRTDFLTHLFPGSLRLFELADSITEIKTICACGSKATVNARIDGNGHVVTKGEQVFLGGNDSYLALLLEKTHCPRSSGGDKAGVTAFKSSFSRKEAALFALLLPKMLELPSLACYNL